MSTASDLRAAADHLEKVGWQQGSYLARQPTPIDERPCCAVGAIGVVTEFFTADPKYPDLHLVTTSERVTRRYLAARVALERQVADGCGIRSVPAWNDTPGRKASEVIATLRYAAETAEAGA